jgi:peptidoglycan/xylan/chitin deacetylase (PgdA/CDA1 family)
MSNIKKVLVASVAISCSLSLPATADAKWAAVGGDPGFVTFTFDDGTASQFDSGFPIMLEAELPATIFITSGKLDQLTDDFFMSWDDVRIMSSAGWEIGAHTVTHRALPTLSDVQVVGELIISLDRIEEESGIRPVSVASPFGEYDERTMVHIAKYYDLHVRAWGDNLGFNSVAVDPLLIERVNIDSTLTSEDVCAMVRAVQSDQWLVLMFHQVTDQSAPYISSPKQLKEIAKCAKSAQQQGKIIVDTLSAVHELITTSQQNQEGE